MWKPFSDTSVHQYVDPVNKKLFLPSCSYPACALVCVHLRTSHQLNFLPSGLFLHSPISFTRRQGVLEPSFNLWGKPVLHTALREDLAQVEKAQKRTEEESESWKSGRLRDIGCSS